MFWATRMNGNRSNSFIARIICMPPESTFGMFVGALIFWIMKMRHPTPGTKAHEVWVEGMEPICAGLISGAALVGIANAIVNVLVG